MQEIVTVTEQKILIVESNTPDLISNGYRPAADYFISTFGALDETVICSVTRPYEAPLKVQELEGIDGVVFTGSSVDWSCDSKQAAPLRDTMSHAFKNSVPVWGSCNGLQLAGVVLGGSVGASSNGIEAGVSKEIRKTVAGKKHAMLTGREDIYAVPCIHIDEIKRLPLDAVILAENDHSPVQAFGYSSGGLDFWGTQYHPECTAFNIAEELKLSSKHVFNKAALVNDLKSSQDDPVAAERLGTSCEELKPSVRTIELRNWLEHIKVKKPH